MQVKILLGSDNDWGGATRPQTPEISILMMSIVHEKFKVFDFVQNVILGAGFNAESESSI